MNKNKPNKPIFIAEIGMNYNSNFDLAVEMIKQSKLSGADIAKFQIGWRDKPGEINYITKDDINLLLKEAKFYDIELMFSIINENAFQMFCDFDFKSVKIASRTSAHDIELTRKIVDLNLNTYISFGMCDVNSFPIKKSENHKYLFCVSKYPTYYTDLTSFPEDFSNSIYDGYSDHTHGIEMCLFALSRGASIIEKHFTLDKSENNIRDHALSANPEEFKKMVDLGTIIYKINKTIS